MSSWLPRPPSPLVRRRFQWRPALTAAGGGAAHWPHRVNGRLSPPPPTPLPLPTASPRPGACAATRRPPAAARGRAAGACLVVVSFPSRPAPFPPPFSCPPLPLSHPPPVTLSLSSGGCRRRDGACRFHPRPCRETGRQPVARFRRLACVYCKRRGWEGSYPAVGGLLCGKGGGEGVSVAPPPATPRLYLGSVRRGGYRPLMGCRVDPCPARLPVCGAGAHHPLSAVAFVTADAAASWSPGEG